MKICAAVLSFAICVAAVSAHGQTQAESQALMVASSPQQDAVKIAHIRRLLELMGSAQQMPEVMRAMMNQMQAVTNSMAKPGDSEEKSREADKDWTRMQEIMINKMKDLDFVGICVPIYDRHYTLEEINALIAFYESPVGRKTLEVQPQISMESMQAMMPAVQKFVEETENETKKKDVETGSEKPAHPVGNGAKDHAVMRVQKGGDVEMATSIKRVPPHYPESARQKHIEGTVRLDTVIDTDGSVLEVKYMSGPAELVQAAIDAVKQWLFRPTTLNGVPVQVECIFDVNFNLKR